MPPATSLAKPLARPISQCPYCGHVSPAESKFCNECGAALHLMPCPHCGAVNDITQSTVCYRCHGELREHVAAAPSAPAASAPAKPESPQPEASPYVIVEPARQRPHALVVAIVLIAFAAASYYALRQRSELDVREPVAAELKGRSIPADTSANAGAGSIIKVPADVVPRPAPTAAAATVEKGVAAGAALPVDVKAAKPDSEPPRDAAASPVPTAATAARSNAGKSGAGREAAGSPATALVSTAESARARIDASKGLEKQPPNIGPCTDAVAALGLCTPEPTPRRP